MTREVFVLCEYKKSGRRFELKFALKNEEEEDCLVQDLNQEYIINDICHKKSDKPIEKYSKNWGRVGSDENLWWRLDGRKRKTVATIYE